MFQFMLPKRTMKSLSKQQKKKIKIAKNTEVLKLYPNVKVIQLFIKKDLLGESKL